MSLQWEHGSTTLTGAGVTLPHPSSVQDWQDDVTTCPCITTSKIISYFLQSKEIDAKAMDNLKASEEYLYVHPNKVGCVMSYKHDGFVFLKADVESSSQCVNKEEYTAWVLVTEAGEVRTAGCSCGADPGRTCPHSFVILLKVEDAVRQGKIPFVCPDDCPFCTDAGSKRNASQRKMRYVRSKRRKRKDLYQPPPTSQPASTTPKPAREVKLFKTHEEWRNHVLASPMAELFTCPGNSLLQLCLNADVSHN
ncbi:uncharacterized protein LOC133447589 [Cololabis saira]|uniref:uncharacterized protein LOC133447589 n=1 Tax=Cololabis saira TaxID=129043 RepID=UPI002AD52366|nr:uncharacterized protein LOC133447589 [Cololabis saira]